MLRLLIKETAYKFQLSRAFEPKVDRETGLIRMDRESGKQLHIGEMVGFGPAGAEVFVVTIAADSAPKIGLGDPITVTGLVAMPWTTKEGDLRVAFRAESVAPLSASRAA